MAYRNIYVSKKSYLNLENNNIRLSQEDLQLNIPIEDVISIVLDDKETTLTQRFISACTDNEIVLFITDDKHLPTSYILPTNSFSKPLLRILDQINFTEPFKKRIWTTVVIQKIKNQAETLKLCEKKYHRLQYFIENIKSGDSSNMEAQAASYYFTELFYKDFSRDKECRENFYLNYSYSLIRGLVARTLVSYGFNCALGIHHRNQYNLFNLADDFIEPIRPLADLFILSNLNQLNDLQNITDVKKYLMNLLNMQMRWRGEKHRINTVIERMVVSFVSSIENDDYKLLVLPEIINLKEHEYRI